MNTKLCGIIFSTVFLLELTTAKTVTHHETIIKSNGDKIERSWTTYEGDETELNKNYDFPPNVFENDKNAANDDNSKISPFFNNFALVNPSFVKPGYNAVDTNKEIPEKKLPPGKGSGQFEEAWDMEPNPESEQELEPQPIPAPELDPEPEPEPQPEPDSAESNEAEHDWKSRKVDDPMEIQPKPTNTFSHTFNSNGFEMRPVTIQQPTEQETPYNINRVLVTQTYSSKPTQTQTQTQTVRTKSYSGPQTVFTGVWPNMVGGWTMLNENPKQPSWQNMSPKPYPVGDEKTVQKPGNTIHSKPTVMVQSEIYPNKSLDDLLKELMREQTAATTTTTTTVSPTPAKPKLIKTIDIADLPTFYILNNGQPIDEHYLKTLPEYIPVENRFGTSDIIHNISMTQDIDIGAVTSSRPLTPSRNIPRPPPPPRPLTPSRNIPRPPPPPRPLTPSRNIPRPSPPPRALTPSRNIPRPPPPRRTTPSTTTTPKPQAASYQSNIAKFLKKVDLSMNDILFQTAARTIKKTIIDDNGDILTATFTLSSVKDKDADRNKAQIEVKPLK